VTAASLGARAGAHGIGALYVCFRYFTPALARAAWERVDRRCEFLSCNRVVDAAVRPGGPLPSTTSGPQLVIVLAEDDERGRREIAKAERLLARGALERIEPPPSLLEASRANRALAMRRALQAGRREARERVRAAAGTLNDVDGRQARIVAGRG